MNQRLVRSFFAVAVGWMGGLLYYLAAGAGVTLGRRGLPNIALYTGIISVLVWAFMFVPLVFAFPPGAAVFRLRVFPWIGGLLGLVAFFFLLYWWLPIDDWFWIVYPMVIGAIAAATFSITEPNAAANSPPK